MKSTLKDHMTPFQREQMKGLPTHHNFCKAQTGVYRPGKTKRDRAKRAAA